MILHELSFGSLGSPKYYRTQGEALTAAQELIGTTRLKLFITQELSCNFTVQPSIAYTVQHTDGSYAILKES